MHARFKKLSSARHEKRGQHAGGFAFTDAAIDFRRMMTGWLREKTRAVLDSAIRAMADHRGSRWLVDGRDIRAIKQSHQDWITENLLPRALEAGLRVAAIVIPTAAEAKLNIDNMAKAADNAIDIEFYAYARDLVMRRGS